MSKTPDAWNPCHECGAYQLKRITADSKIELHTEYLVYNEADGEWNIAQWDGVRWESTISDDTDSCAITHYQELPEPEA